MRLLTLADEWYFMCSITSCGDSCIQPEGGLGLDGVPRLKLMLTQMQLAPVECDDSAAAAFYCQADFAAPEVTATLCLHPRQCPAAVNTFCFANFQC